MSQYNMISLSCRFLGSGLRKLQRWNNITPCPHLRYPHMVRIGTMELMVDREVCEVGLSTENPVACTVNFSA